MEQHFQAPEISLSHNINSRLTAVLSIRKGHTAMGIFSMILGILSMDRKTFVKCLAILPEFHKACER